MPKLSGPFLSPDAPRMIQAELERTKEDIAQTGYNQVMIRLGQVLRNPTGYYESRIQTTTVSADTDKVHDSNVVYGPWLEGTGSRNSTTRFKGYATFRLVAQQLQRDAGAIADRHVTSLVRELS